MFHEHRSQYTRYLCSRHTSNSEAVKRLVPVNCAWPLRTNHVTRAQVIVTTADASPAQNVLVHAGELDSSRFHVAAHLQTWLEQELATARAAAHLEVAGAEYGSECPPAI